MPTQIERSICCNEDATFNELSNQYICKYCGEYCEIVDWSEPDNLTDSQLKEVKQWEREEREAQEDFEHSRGI